MTGPAENLRTGVEYKTASSQTVGPHPSKVKSTLPHATISSHVFFVTIRPKPSSNF